jgi:hypothetical protein
MQVSADGTIRHLPQFAAIETDKYGKAVIIPPPRDMGDKIVYPGNVFREDGQPLWIAPSPEAPREIMAVEYLGCDGEQRDIFMVTTPVANLMPKLRFLQLNTARSLQSDPFLSQLRWASCAIAA